MNYLQISSESTGLKADIKTQFQNLAQNFLKRNLKKIEECQWLDQVLSFLKIYHLLDPHNWFLIYDVCAAMQLGVN